MNRDFECLGSAADEKALQFARKMLELVDYEPTGEQMELIAGFARFCVDGADDMLFLLNGYAGTGKTSLTGALVRTLTAFGMKSVLLAPTGRAAKVFSEYAGHPAYTIHRKIYRQRSYGAEGAGSFVVAENKHADTIFIVDEASMIANGQAESMVFGSVRLLDDLVHYVYSGSRCRLVLLGDNAQLPPVGLDESPALDAKELVGYGLKVVDFNLRSVARQRAGSGILENATLLRRSIEDFTCGRSKVLEPPVLHLSGYDDITALSSEYMVEEISDSYDRNGIKDVTVITRSNKRAAMFNMGIRNSILYREDELVTGDMLLVAKNNYLWSEGYDGLDFIANGEVGRVARVRGEVEERYGLRFATVELELPDHEIELEAKVVLDALFSESAALTREQVERMYMSVMSELPGDKRSRYRALKKNPYFNALQVKYGYAVTCHKAQGGQWNDVFVDMGAIPEDALSSIQFYRWLYTALTRARGHVYLINSPLRSE